ncbi:CPBP family intramembrane glutamic endopeptidase [Streptococcus chenjunshii]|uniref:CPBP family intramembrane glutamic endopeptidase n=1 Tax=Streptococcus chenjunshii TaxID=2173853 RepID=UPI001F544A8A|nr:CPBP family intramembrane glutamic endopeptidase [Streptococcus chenjunshii]
MEEGIFRGLFQKLFERRYSFITAAVFSALLFGLWHIVGPIRNFFDGEVNAAGMIVNAALLAAVSALVGFRYSLMAKLTDSLYMGMADHFFNNTIINMLHVWSVGGSDELLFIRIGAAQILSFSLVLICYLANKHRKTS